MAGADRNGAKTLTPSHTTIARLITRGKPPASLRSAERMLFRLFEEQWPPRSNATFLLLPGGFITLEWPGSWSGRLGWAASRAGGCRGTLCPGVVGRGRAEQHGLAVLDVFRDRADFQLAQSLIVVVVGERAEVTESVEEVLVGRDLLMKVVFVILVGPARQKLAIEGRVGRVAPLVDIEPHAPRPRDQASRVRPSGAPSAVGGALALIKIRGIPLVFSWMQVRSGLTGWYGVGTALGGADLCTLREMYQG